MEQEQEEEYIVEAIIDKRFNNDQIEYKVKWFGYSVQECTWEPLEHLDRVLNMVNDFERKRKEKKLKERDRSEKKTMRKNMQQEMSALPAEYGEIRELRRDTRKKITRFLVALKDNRDFEKWVQVDELLETHSKLLCDFLLRHLDMKK